MRVSTIAGLLFTAAFLATIPVSPQPTQRGVELRVDQAQAITYGRYRRVTRRAYRRAVMRPPAAILQQRRDITEVLGRPATARVTEPEATDIT